MDRSEWFEWEAELPREAEKFLDTVRSEAERWLDADPTNSQVYKWEDFLVLGLDVSDRTRNRVLRTLRADYGPSGLTYGEDETYQFATDLTPKQHEYGHIDHGNQTPADLGQIAAAWLRTQMVRPIELAVWQRPFYWCTQYQLMDTGRWLCWSAKGNQPRSSLGLPDSISIVKTLNNQH